MGKKIIFGGLIIASFIFFFGNKPQKADANFAGPQTGWCTPSLGSSLWCILTQGAANTVNGYYGGNNIHIGSFINGGANNDSTFVCTPSQLAVCTSAQGGN